jgi:hypothetical protein
MNCEMSSGASVNNQDSKSKPNINGHASSVVDQQSSLEKLAHTSPPSSGPVIALDLDDVLSLTNPAVAACMFKKGLKLMLGRDSSSILG